MENQSQTVNVYIDAGNFHIYIEIECVLIYIHRYGVVNASFEEIFLAKSTQMRLLFI